MIPLSYLKRIFTRLEQHSGKTPPLDKFLTKLKLFKITTSGRRIFNHKRYFWETPTFKTAPVYHETPQHMACIKCDLPTPREKAQIWTTQEDASHSRKKKNPPYSVHTLSKMQGASSKALNSAPQIAWVKQQPHLAETAVKDTGTQGRAFITSQLWPPSPPLPVKLPKSL